MIDRDYRRKFFVKNLLNKPTIENFDKNYDKERKKIGEPIKGYICSQQKISSRESGRQIRVRIYRHPLANSKTPGILYCHGGGSDIKIPESDHRIIKTMLDATPCVVIAPDYRSALYDPYPAGLNDIEDTLEWMQRSYKVLKFNESQIFTVGTSGGGNLILGLNLMLRDKNKSCVAYQMPLYPCVDCRGHEGKEEAYHPWWNHQHLHFVWQKYLKDTQQQVPYYAAPSLCEDLSNLPPTSSYIAALDPCYEEVSTFFEKLKNKGVAANLKTFEGVYHGFETIYPHGKKSQHAFDFIKKNLLYAKEHYKV